MWFGPSDGALLSVAVPPVQFQDIWSSRSEVISPERGLALAIVQQALNDLASHRFARGRRGQRLYWEAYGWVAADDRVWPFSFVNLCEALGLEVEPLRRRVLDPMTRTFASAARLDAVPEAILGKAA